MTHNLLGKREMLLTETPPITQHIANQQQAGGPANNIQQRQPDQPDDDGGDDEEPDDETQDANPHKISTSDFFIMQSSFECKMFQHIM